MSTKVKLAIVSIMLLVMMFLVDAIVIAISGDDSAVNNYNVGTLLVIWAAVTVWIWVMTLRREREEQDDRHIGGKPA